MIEDHPKYAQLQTLVSSLIVKTKNKQADYFVLKGRFFQGLKIPTTSLAHLDGVTNSPIGYGNHPTDQDDSWGTFDSANYNVTTRIPVHVSIDVYQATDGWGWILRIEFWHNGLGPDKYGQDGDHWVFRHNEGPENFQGIWDDWHIESEE